MAAWLVNTLEITPNMGHDFSSISFKGT